MKTLATFIALFVFATASEAKVLIYQGAFTSRTGPVNLGQTSGSLFLLLDTETDQINVITFFRAGATRHQQLDTPIQIQRVSADIASGRSASVLSLNTSVPISNGDFVNGLFYLRGTNTTINVETAGVTTINLPRVFTGPVTRTGHSGNLGFFTEQRWTVIYQQARTIKANDANQTLAGAAQSISAELTAKGFLTN